MSRCVIKRAAISRHHSDLRGAADTSVKDRYRQREVAFLYYAPVSGSSSYRFATTHAGASNRRVDPCPITRCALGPVSVQASHHARATHRRTNMQLRRGSRYWLALTALTFAGTSLRAQGFGLNEISTCGLGRGYAAVEIGR